MSKAERVYTERVTVRLLAAERSALLDALEANAALSAALRDAGLRAIGRDDLVIHTQDPSGTRAQKVADPKDSREYALSYVRLTKRQLAALDVAARDQDKALSAVMRDALMAELGLPVREALTQWYPLGKRRSRPPGTKPKATPKSKVAKKRRKR